jgi:hypothetical protein
MARVGYDEFLLEVRHDGEIEATLITQEGEETGPRQGHLHLDDQIQRIVKVDIKQLRVGKLDAERFELLGRSLYKALFHGGIGNLFEEAVEDVREKDRRLRVSIRVDPRCTEVADWPLEFLCAPDGRWLATSSLITLSRRLRFDKAKFEPARDPSLRVLVVVSRPNEPEELRGVMAGKTIEDIAGWAAVEVGEGQMETDVKLLGHIEEFEQQVTGVKYLNESATFGHLGECARAWSPHVLHFIGHGQLKDDTPALALVKDTGEVDWCGPRDFVPLFADWRPRLVVLHACESAKPTTGPGFMSLAAHLVKQNIPAVVAMQFEISNDYATEFAARFYKFLAQGWEIDRAVQEGRLKISTLGVRWGERHFGTPVLFMLSPDGIIHPVATVARPAPGREPDRAARPSDTGEWLLQVAQEARRRGEKDLEEQAAHDYHALVQKEKKGKVLKSAPDQAKQRLQAQGLPSSKRATPGG